MLSTSVTAKQSSTRGRFNMNKTIVGIAKMIILRRDTSDAGATVLKSDYLKGRAAEGDYILEQLRVFFPDEVAQAKSEIYE